MFHRNDKGGKFPGVTHAQTYASALQQLLKVLICVFYYLVWDRSRVSHFLIKD